MTRTPVALFFLLPSVGGGSTTFTAHLFKAFEAAGYDPLLYRVRKRTENRTRPFGQYEGIRYLNVSHDDALEAAHSMPSIMTAAGQSKDLVHPELIQQLARNGTRIVVHDPNEFKVYDHLQNPPPGGWKPFCIRPTMKRFFPDAVWIPHPYQRADRVHFGERDRHAISVARVASVKRTAMILDANRLLPPDKRVVLYGAEHRLYSYGLAQRYPEYEQSGKTFQFPKTFHDPVVLCSRAWFNVDLTYFPDDGGGTQYAMMEAMDAGCVNIMHQDWFRYGGEVKPGKHMIAIDGPEQLAEVLRYGKDREDLDSIREAGYKLLHQHRPRRVGKLYAKEMGLE